ncbi:hypothetical protein CYMTET_29917 [Cymbomonas tetramitiformis]|uniref:UBC core domain-containing protein n=1 Tax=Cymbomonas tetramitiformis TaxID=36881 RepID=A0AAE0FK38_9CHLO|nr:hypothetical protein CYMTET_29917 [Cymbomonas tetramitiformis]
MSDDLQEVIVIDDDSPTGRCKGGPTTGTSFGQQSRRKRSRAEENVEEVQPEVATPENSQASKSMERPCPNGVPWKGKRGPKRLTLELTYMMEQTIQKTTPIYDLQLVSDSLFQWQFKLKDFDDSTPAGRDLNSDLSILKQRYDQDHILMEARFPSDYPNKPFSLRVISPRMVWYTGHVTAGGSVCIEALTLSRSKGAWQPDFSFEGIMNTVCMNMLDEERVKIETATGPGGMSGPLRIDLQHMYNHRVMMPYSLSEAEAAFRRMEAHHRREGW